MATSVSLQFSSTTVNSVADTAEIYGLEGRGYWQIFEDSRSNLPELEVKAYVYMQFLPALALLM